MLADVECFHRVAPLVRDLVLATKHVGSARVLASLIMLTPAFEGLTPRLADISVRVPVLRQLVDRAVAHVV
eukprot:CAMPEP_0206058728 /NCGR_PEP_ID=MMETSP1466-20131121/47306_1 /ASSEMBLY_ACC=CAM_ASM_001126 /TAXON_ID=44452 /ORGANISM="Pavlova gyrans, Strain CCMP608" /LENGTH=70 /DNA_ID=CAMNT_0053434029 /DNA_START=301 /DNA_END=509 /DNA_ORIENTATION=-